MEEIKKISAVLTLKSDEFNKSISDVNKELKLAQAEVQNSDAKLRVYGKSMDTLQTKHDTLQNKINSLKDKTNLYTESINKNNEKLNKNREDLDNLAKKKDELNKKYDEAVKLYGKESEQAKTLKNDLDNLKSEYREKENQIRNNINTINTHNEKLVKTETELVKTQGELKNTSKELEGLSGKFEIAGKSTEELSSKFKDVGSKLNNAGNNILKFTAPLAVLGAGAIKVGVDFESAMSNVSAISGATGEELEKLSEKAKEMGANTSKSATDSADAMSYMALAGWDSTQIISGIEPVLRLAEAGNLDLARASDLVTDSMSALGLEVSELPQFLDKVAKSSATSNTSIDQLMEAFLIVGGKANSLGVDVDELSTVLGVMANRGIKGAEAGRGLSAILTNLTAPTGQAKEALADLGLTAFDKQGNFIGLENVIKNLSRSTENLTQEEKNLYLSQIAGKEHAKTLNAIMASLTEEYEGLKQGINSADGALSKMANTMQDNTKGGFTKLKSQLEGLGIQFSEHLLPHINRLIEGLSKLLDWFGGLDEGTQKTIVNMGLLAIGLGGTLKAVGGLSQGIGGIIGIIGKVAPLIGSLTGGIGALTGGAVAGGGAIAGIGTALVGALAPIAPFALAIGGIAAAGYAVNKCLSQEVIPTIDLFADKIEYINTGFNSYGITYQTVVTTISESTKTAVGAYMELDTQATNTLMSMTYGYSEVSRISSESLNEMSASFFENILAVGEGSEELKEKLIAEFNSALNGVNVTTGEGLNEVVTMFAQQYFEVEEVTEDMKNQVIEMFNLTKLETTSTTQTLGDELVSIFGEMGNKINTEMSTKREEDLVSLRDFLENSKLITQEEYTTMVEQTNTAYDTKKQTAEDIQNQIKEILTRAKDEHRVLTEEEVLSIAELQSKMKENAIKILSQNEVEANVILERMKANDARVTAEKAGEHIKKLNEQRDGAIKAAEEEYNKVLASIVRMRDETGVVTSEQADKMIEEATRQKDETIKKAEETREGAVNTILGMNEDLKDSVDSTTGEIMTWWDKLKNWWDGWFPSKKTFETETVEVTVQRTVYESSGGNVQANALGTNYFQGGLTKINERGFELVELPRGSKIFNNDASERYINRAVEELISKFNNNSQPQTINIYSPRPLNAYEVSKQLKRQQRELLLGRYI